MTSPVDVDSGKRDILPADLVAPVGFGVGGAATAAASHKASKDLNRLARNMTRWNRKTTLPEIATYQQITKAFRDYAEHGQTVMKSRILGMPIPYWGMRGTFKAERLAGDTARVGTRALAHLGQVVDKYMLGGRPVLGWGSAADGKPIGLGAKLHQGAWTFGRPDQMDAKLNHYYTFKNKSQNEIVDYLIGKIEDVDFFKKYKDQVPVEALNALRDKDLTLAERFRRFHTYTEDVPEVRRMVKGALTQQANSFGKTTGNATGYADLYRSIFKRHYTRLRTGSRVGKVAGVATMLAALGVGTRRLATSAGKVQNKEASGASDVEGMPLEDAMNILQASMGMTGATLAGKSGLYDLRRKGRIAVSYGEHESLGAGHKEPGKAIATDLRQALKDKGLDKKMMVQNMERRADDVVRRGGRVEVLVDTGFGHGYDYRNPFMRKGLHLSSDPDLKVGRGGLYAYQTDLPYNVGVTLERAREMPTATSIIYGNPDMAATGKSRRLVTSMDDITPAIETAVIKQMPTINARTSEAAAEQLAATAERLGKGAEAAKLRQGLAEGKKFVVISGSGRGDLVSYRALLLEEALKAKGLQNKYQVIALAAGESKYSPLRQVLDARPGIITLDKLPKMEFINAQRAGALHWGSTGASSAAESLLHQTPTALVTDAFVQFRDDSVALADRLLKSKKLRDIPSPNPDNPTWQSALKAVKLHDWNWGTMKRFPGRIGIFKGNSADEIIDLLGKIEADPKLATRIAMRTQDTAREMMRGKRILTDDVIATAMRNLRRTRGRGAVKGVAATLMGLAGAHGIKKAWTPSSAHRTHPEA
jgi:hypothetical protein